MPVFLFCIVTLTLYCCFKLWNIYTYWKKKGVVGPTPWPIVGNYGPVLFRIKSETVLLREIYLRYPNAPCIGMYQGFYPILLIKDPGMIKNVLVSDFGNFNERYIPESAKKLQNCMFVMIGDSKWRLQRRTLLPLFTKNALSKLIPVMIPIVNKYLNFVDVLVSKQSNYEFRSMKLSYAVEVIFAVVMGTELNGFTKKSDVQVFISNFFQLEAQSIIRTIEMICPFVTKPFTEKILTLASKYFNGIMKPLMDKGKTKESGSRISFLDFLIDLQNTGKISKQLKGTITETDLSDDSVVQICATFCIAGLEAISGTIAHSIQELAQHQNIQNKCYEEISTVFAKYDEELTLESILELTYTGMVVDETLRKYSINIIDRKCSSTYTFPGTNITIDKDNYVYIPVNALQYDPKYFPDPELFDPERFSPENKSKIPRFVSMPFSEGPRHCIGRDLGKIITVIGLAAFLHRFKVVPLITTAGETVSDPGTSARTSKREIRLNILRRSDFNN